MSEERDRIQKALDALHQREEQEVMAAELRQLLLHLPVEELDSDAPASIVTIDGQVAVIARRPYCNDAYFLDVSHTVRLRDDGESITTTLFRNGEQVQLPGRDN